MIAGLIGFGVGALAFAGIAVALAIRNGQLDGDNRVLTGDRTRLRKVAAGAALELAAALSRGEQLEDEHEAQVRGIYDRIRESGGAAALGDLAVGELERLLSPPESRADDDQDG
ncbi:MAG TPA: hypothetical protein ENH89_20030 [Aurantimonas coralicida]|uniref:Uncharacterized protein n=1 Tax=Aurantimonas coralicida TaxID=182270 RepID=A0A9C9NJA3_9HYPH|nr:hypothetical protein [Aurantimonas coralicida]